MKTFFFTILILLFSTGYASAQVSVGEEAPDFTHQVLGESEGTNISLSDLEGQVVYIFFYGAGCPHCRTNGPVTETEIYQTFKDDTNFVALGLDTWDDPVSNNQNFRNVTGITYPLLLNAGQTLVDYYGGSGFYDRSVVIGADGFLKYKGTTFVDSDYEDVVDVIVDELAILSTSSEIDNDSPTSIRLDQNYPNPFNPSTTISYQLASPGEVKLQIFNALGQQIATLVDGFQASGSQSISWNATSVPSGIYMYRLIAGGEVLTKRMMLIK
ncbi:MAG: T9SS type A sorting domain-containing protein [Balneolaceae bacterium]|nr:T9SS type A sorting domain-containing protein [Balneolaceae bacterium]MBO6545029.1 T9SS type A sorting domain-containing protein [Balneolaceae bacterium]MBO6646425.1 T9SS type A sorting domain-containing protein [Balneolaceae bacterium]